ncbi:MAG: hypothetical protein EI684_21425 [Candidatus Viridilinea halotolerans]|uniref:Uncharacterized protein n=1 Tax=Candidatus Viridilinea halotolerans TaxID=2491704 RepID=A0A426TRG1_9CHLR|nr:MAG: hypothetical protein EI684_21425 [Candidatus Viridilinea halotolerans]
MGYYFIFTTCIGCGQPFTCHPERVPSLRINPHGQPDPAGTRHPICRTCWDRRQAYRRQHGLPEELLLPGAYAPAPELGDDGSDWGDGGGDA